MTIPSESTHTRSAAFLHEREKRASIGPGSSLAVRLLLLGRLRRYGHECFHSPPQKHNLLPVSGDRRLGPYYCHRRTFGRSGRLRTGGHLTAGQGSGSGHNAVGVAAWAALARA